MKDSEEAEYEPADMQALPSIETETTELMGRVKAGDRAAFDALVASVRDRAFRTAQGLVGAREDALDLAQEALLKVYRSRKSYRDGDPFLPWFHRILRNTCFSFLRKHKKVKKHSLDAPLDAAGERFHELVDERAAPIGRALELEDQARTFRAVFERLSDADREILTLRHFEELSYRQIAEILEVPEGTVMSRLFHARRRLREAIGPNLARIAPELEAELNPPLPH
jgi:RNA polymerase sigma-70 factor, ECF subfamily